MSAPTKITPYAQFATLRCGPEAVPIDTMTLLDSGAIEIECKAEHGAMLMQWLVESWPCSIAVEVNGEPREVDPVWLVDVWMSGNTAKVELKTPMQDARAFKKAIAKLRRVREGMKG